MVPASAVCVRQRDDALAALRETDAPPSLVIDSGGGLHSLYFLDAPSDNLRFWRPAAHLLTARGLGPGYTAIAPTRRFPARTHTVYAVATITDKTPGTTVSFRWQPPRGAPAVFRDTLTTPLAGTVHAYAFYHPGVPGQFTVAVLLDNRQIAITSCTIAGTHA